MICKIYTDGSCMKKCGGWAFCIDSKCGWELSGGEPNTTNNRMELQAIIEAIKYTNEIYEDYPDTYVIIHTDSQLSMRCAKGIYKKKANLDLWDIYNKVSKGKNIEYIWVKAHNGNKYNEIVDKLAKEEAKKILKSC
jgi:ribonuclease HI